MLSKFGKSGGFKGSSFDASFNTTTTTTDNNNNNNNNNVPLRRGTHINTYAEVWVVG